MEATKIHGHIVNIGRLAGMSGNFNYDLHAKEDFIMLGLLVEQDPLKKMKW